MKVVTTLPTGRKKSPVSVEPLIMKDQKGGLVVVWAVIPEGVLVPDFVASVDWAGAIVAAVCVSSCSAQWNSAATA